MLLPLVLVLSSLPLSPPSPRAVRTVRYELIDKDGGIIVVRVQGKEAGIVRERPAAPGPRARFIAKDGRRHEAENGEAKDDGVGTPINRFPLRVEPVARTMCGDLPCRCARGDEGSMAVTACVATGKTAPFTFLDLMPDIAGNLAAQVVVDAGLEGMPLSIEVHFDAFPNLSPDLLRFISDTSEEGKQGARLTRDAFFEPILKAQACWQAAKAGSRLLDVVYGLEKLELREHQGYARLERIPAWQRAGVRPNWSVSLSLTDSGYRAVAEGSGPMEGERWTLTQDKVLVHEASRCAPQR
jgi:hypothetical protein